MIEGIVFEPFKGRSDCKQAVVECKDGSRISIIHCGAFECGHYGTSEKPFEIALDFHLPVSQWQVEGWLTDKEVVSRILERGGLAQ